MDGRIWLIAGLALAAGIGTGIALMCRASRKPRGLSCSLCPDVPEDGADSGFEADAAAEAREALAQVTDYARQHAVFRRDWDSAVRRAADAMTAIIAGRWMAGQAHGEVGWYAPYPVLPAMDGGALEAAFQLAVHGEVCRRIGAMNGPGAFG